MADFQRRNGLSEEAPAYRSTLAAIWAKSPKNGEPAETIIEHTEKVINSLWGLAKRYYRYVGTQIWSRTFWACWLHDFGKAVQPFQKLLRKEIPKWSQRHEIYSLPFARWIAAPGTPDHQWLIAAIASHHKSPDELFSVYYDLEVTDEQYYNDIISSISLEVVKALQSWIKSEWRQWAERFESLGILIVPPRNIDAENWSPSGAETQEGLLNYRRFSREIQRSPNHSDLILTGTLIRGAMQFSDHVASANCGELIELSLPGPVKLKQLICPDADGWRDHQKACGEIRGNVVLAAPTGSGKTEAALLWAYNQTKNQTGQGVLLYLLPFQASMNAMRARLKEVLGHEIALLHGRAVQALFRELCESGGFEPKTAEKTARYLNELSRLYQRPVWIASPYQLLRAAFRLPGYEILWTVLTGSTIVIDEVHAYETDRLGMILELMKTLVEDWQARVMVMTATMPSWLREIWVETLTAESVLPGEPVYRKAIRHRIQVVPGNLKSAGAFEIIEESHKRRELILVAVNSIKTAQMVWEDLSNKYGTDNVLLIHGRLNSRDRLIREKQIIRRAGFESAGGPCIVVATQVIEVSLNLDFDVIISEPAPLEALLQRFGRVNRRGRKGIRPVYVLTGQSEDYQIYDNRLVTNTIAVLQKHDGEVIMEKQVTEWLNWIYDQDGLRDEWLNKIERSRRDFRVNCLESMRPFAEDKDLEKIFEDLFDGCDVLPASLTEEYDRLLKESVIAAHSLLVSIDRWRMFTRKCEWNKERKIWITDTTYDSLLGLK